VFGAIEAGPIPATYREFLVIISGMEVAFFGTLTLSLSYYHRRWKLGLWGAVLSVLLPYAVNLAWIKISGSSLIYPTVALVVLGGITIGMIHSKVSGPQADGVIEEELIRNFIQEMDSNFTWVDRVTWLCFAVGAVMLLVLLLRRL